MFSACLRAFSSFLLPPKTRTLGDLASHKSPVGVSVCVFLRVCLDVAPWCVGIGPGVYLASRPQLAGMGSSTPQLATVDEVGIENE